MAKSFREAFQGVQEHLERLLETRYVLLQKLKDRGVITNWHNILVGVIWHVVHNECSSVGLLYAAHFSSYISHDARGLRIRHEMYNFSTPNKTQFF